MLAYVVEDVTLAKLSREGTPKTSASGAGDLPVVGLLEARGGARAYAAKG
jgi:hypothetical protein